MSIQRLKDYLENANVSMALTEILRAISESSVFTANAVREAPLSGLYGVAGSTNVQGEAVQKLDVLCDDEFADRLLALNVVAAIVSEERETISTGKAVGPEKYLVSLDPLDGSSNIDVNVAIGTIFGIQKFSGNELSEKSFLQQGTELVAAGYVMYGASTILVISVGRGVAFFSYSEQENEFLLVQSEIKMPDKGNIYSCNQGNAANWSPGVQHYLKRQEEKGTSLRYVGSLVADFHRSLFKGGVFFYPNDAKSPHGKLRLLYECAPMAFLAEQSGGAASNGSMRILEVVPSGIHQRVPLYIGSREMISELESCIAENG